MQIPRPGCPRGSDSVELMGPENLHSLSTQLGRSLMPLVFDHSLRSTPSEGSPPSSFPCKAEIPPNPRVHISHGRVRYRWLPAPKASGYLLGTCPPPLHISSCPAPRRRGGCALHVLIAGACLAVSTVLDFPLRGPLGP